MSDERGSAPMRQPRAQGEPLALHDIVADAAHRHPLRPVLVDGDQSWTCSELADQVAGMAAELQSRGVRQGDTVALIQPRSAELVLSALAVLRCGGTYAAIDPLWPAQRRDALVHRLAARLVLSTAPDIAAGPPEPVRVDPASAATVLFTSGTTGGPKGVAISHAGVARLFPVSGAIDFSAPPGRTHPVVTLSAATPWDGFAYEMWGVLCSGGTGVVVREPMLMPERIRELVDRRGLTYAFLTTSVFHLLVEEDPAAFTGLHTVCVGGERMSPSHARRFLTSAPDTALVNVYGPCESTIATTSHQVRLADCDLPRLPVGRPARGTRVLILDGEICVAGEALAIGYVGQPELTAACFVSRTVQGRRTRVYLTGDVGAWLPDGTLDCLGRLDRQVKVRGHRVEPGEIEAAALAVPGVNGAAVLPLPGGGERVTGLLLGYVGSARPQQVDERLRAVLPAYLVPQALVPVPVLPLLANGKLDELALRRLVPTDAAIGPVVTPGSPSGAADQVRDVADQVRDVADAMAEVLDLPAVGADDDFFRLGGSSLAAARLSVRLGRILERAIPLDVVMARPTARRLADWIAAGGPQNVTDPGADLAGAVAITTSQLPFLLTALGDPDDSTALCPLVWDVDGPIDQAALRAALRDVAGRHQALSARYTLVDDLPAVVVGPPRPVNLLVVDDPAVLPDALLTPLDVEQGQVWRAGLAPGRFAMVIHHLALDATAARVLAADLGHAYAARIASTSFGAALPDFGPAPVPLSVIAAERLRLCGDLARQREHWRTALAGADTLVLPAGSGGHGLQHAEARLSGQVLAGCDQVAQRTGTTRAVVLLDSYARALTRLTGASDLCIGMPVSRRHTPVLRDAVTCLIDMACVRVCGPGPRAARDGLLDALANLDVGVHEVARLSRTRPPYRTILSVPDDAIPDLRWGSTVGRYVRSDTRDLDVDLAVELFPDGTLRVSVQRDRVAEHVAGEVLAALQQALPGGPEELHPTTAQGVLSGRGRDGT